MIRIYLDWNVISKLKTDEYSGIRSFLDANKDKISMPFSPAHFEDISKSDNPGNDKIHEDIETMEHLCRNYYLAYDKEKDMALPYIASPSVYYNQYKSSPTTISEVINPENFEKFCGIDVIESDPRIRQILNMPVRMPELNIPESLPFYKLDSRQNEVITLKELILLMISIINKIMTDRETYKALRGTKGAMPIPNIEGSPSEIIPFLNSCFEKAGLEYNFMGLVGQALECQKSDSFFMRFLTTYLLLDMFYKSDKLHKKGNNATNIVADAMHAYYAAYCDYFVTDDKRLAEKAAVLYKEFHINVPIISSKEIPERISPLLWQNTEHILDIIKDIVSSSYFDNRSEAYGVNENDDEITWIVAFKRYYFNFFNYANVSLLKNNNVLIITMLRRFSCRSRYVFYNEVAQLLTLLSDTFGEIPESLKKSIIECEKDFSCVWRTDDNRIAIQLSEDTDYKGRPKLTFVIDLMN